MNDHKNPMGATPGPSKDHHNHNPEMAKQGPKVHDPVCGMIVDPQTAKHSHTHQGEQVFF